MPEPPRQLDPSNLSDQTLQEMMAVIDLTTEAEQQEDHLLQMMPGVGHAIR